MMPSPPIPGFKDFVDAVRDHPDRLYLDVGCGRRGRTYDNCLYLDVYPSPSADIVMEPPAAIRSRRTASTGIGCFAVLEHVTEPWTAAAEFRRMLKPGGLVFIDYPFLVPVHGYPLALLTTPPAPASPPVRRRFEQLRSETLRPKTVPTTPSIGS
jgi:SAM-dependent methyltransferase